MYSNFNEQKTKTGKRYFVPLNFSEAILKATPFKIRSEASEVAERNNEISICLPSGPSPQTIIISTPHIVMAVIISPHPLSNYSYTQVMQTHASFWFLHRNS